MVFGASSFDFAFVVFMFAFINVEGDGCFSETLTATKEARYLTSPGYPLRYQNNLNCIWKIVGPQNSKLKVKILSSDIGRQVTCEGDYVQVFDGNKDAASLGTFCGVNTPSYRSSGSTITIRFISDGSGTGRGFRLQYYYTDSQTYTSAFLCGIGICVGVILFFLVLCKITFRFARKRHERRIELETRPQNQHVEMPAGIVAPNSNNTELSAPPPTYNDIVNSNIMNNNKDNMNDTSPPPYASLRISDS